MKLSPLEKRAERRDRNKSGLDMNLVSLIDIFTILIFFLMSGATGVELLPSNKAVKLPDSTSQRAGAAVVVLVSGSDIIVGGRLIASVADVLRTDGDLISSLKAELDLPVQPPGDPQGKRGKDRASARSWATRTFPTACCAR